MPKARSSIKIDEDLWKRFKIYCIEHDQQISDVLERLIREELERSQKASRKG